jgi:hypothetical protein
MEEKRTPVYFNSDELRVWKWVCKNYEVFSVAEKLKGCKIIFNNSPEGKVIPEFNVYNPKTFNNFTV